MLPAKLSLALAKDLSPKNLALSSAASERLETRHQMKPPAKPASNAIMVRAIMATLTLKALAFSQRKKRKIKCSDIRCPELKNSLIFGTSDVELLKNFIQYLDIRQPKLKCSIFGLSDVGLKLKLFLLSQFL